MGSKKQSYQGKIATKVEKGTTSNGKLFVKFSVRSGSELIDCVAWYSMLEANAPIDDLAKDKNIIMRGFFGENNNGNAEEFVIKWFELTTEVIQEGQKPQSSYREQLKKSLNTTLDSKVDKHLFGVRSEMSARGFVLVNINGFKTWVNRKHALQYNGKWYDRAEFLMDHLGADVVSSELRAAGITISDRRQNVERYHELLEKLIPQAIAAAEGGDVRERGIREEEERRFREEGRYPD